MILGLLSEWPPPLHEPVERTVDLPTRLRSLATDTSLLIRFHGFDAPLGEPRRVVDYDGVGLDFAAGREAHHLRDDLSTADIESRPRCHDLPAVADPSEALGSL